jgi:tripartite-type tricarboxylate transporter receptor subunit TctC
MLSTIAGSFAQQAGAQTYPSGPIHIIVPYAAGGLVDAIARVIGARIAEAMGQPIIVENRPGASSSIGMQACANAKPDGHTVCPTTADSLSGTTKNCSRCRSRTAPT